MTDSLSEKRRAAGRKGAQARWGARNTAGDGDDDLVCGTAAELREMAEAIEQSDTRALTRARAISNSRVTAYRTRHPKATAADLAGKVVCEAHPAEDEPSRDRPKLRVVNESAEVAELWIYDYIDSWGGYWGISASEVVEQLAEISASRIDVHINSYGGEVFEGIAIRRALVAHDAEVYVCVDSVAASIASVIAMAGDTVAMDPAAMLMIHDASGFCMGNAGDMLSMASLLDKISDTIAGVYATRASGTVGEWRTRMLAETWFTATEAIAAGLADETLSGTEDDEPAQPAAVVGGRPAIVNQATAPPPASPAEALDPLEGIDWDPEAFKAGITLAAAESFDWDPDVFRAALTEGVQQSHFGPEPVPEPEPDLPDMRTLVAAFKEAMQS